MPITVYTIGHSNHPIDVFLDLLHCNRIQVLADVRSSPYSRWQPQFNQSDLRASLLGAGLRYEPFCDELGARTSDRSCYDQGRVVYARLANSVPFQKGIARLRDLALAQRVAIVCAEREPLECHRTILIGRALESEGDKVVSILGDGSTEEWTQLVSRLLRRRKLNASSLFESEDEIIERAFLAQEEEIAYRSEQTGKTA